VIVSENTSFTPRTATVTVIAGDIQVTLTVEQAANTPTLTLDKTTISSTKDGGISTISATCDTDWKVTSSQSWAVVSPSTGTGNNTFSVIVSENRSSTPRTAIVTVTAGYIQAKLMVEQAADPSGTVTDIDGNVYNTTTIGTQIWITENLKTTKYNDGTAIIAWTNGVKYDSVNIPLMYYYGNSIANAATYGALYNEYVVGTEKLCPAGWHVPDHLEWTTLIDYVGADVAGTKLKATSGWNDNGNGTDDYGFKALPGGRSDVNDDYDRIGFRGSWWSASIWYSYNTTYQATGFYPSYSGRGVYEFPEAGLSVRCLRD
jgi:uncharacterized protein (TIGR02145 family)